KNTIAALIKMIICNQAACSCRDLAVHILLDFTLRAGNVPDTHLVNVPRILISHAGGAGNIVIVPAPHKKRRRCIRKSTGLYAGQSSVHVKCVDPVIIGRSNMSPKVSCNRVADMKSLGAFQKNRIANYRNYEATRSIPVALAQNSFPVDASDVGWIYPCFSCPVCPKTKRWHLNVIIGTVESNRGPLCFG